jgi:hypothetical protein
MVLITFTPVLLEKMAGTFGLKVFTFHLSIGRFPKYLETDVAARLLIGS